MCHACGGYVSVCVPMVPACPVVCQCVPHRLNAPSTHTGMLHQYSGFRAFSVYNLKVTTVIGFYVCPPLFNTFQ